MKLIKRGWPEHISKVPMDARAYIQVKLELSEHNGLILRGSRIVMPRSMRGGTLQNIHDGHQGMNKCREKVCSSVWWPGLSAEINRLVTSCQVCCEWKRTQQKGTSHLHTTYRETLEENCNGPVWAQNRIESLYWSQTGKLFCYNSGGSAKNTLYIT